MVKLLNLWKVINYDYDKGKKMIIIPQTKGGVGKSTVAMQVIAPYLFKKHGKK